jgi:hypothetical protein
MYEDILKLNNYLDVLYIDWLQVDGNENKDRYEFLVEGIMGMITNSSSLSHYYGKMIIKVARNIINGQVKEKITDINYYRDHVLYCNLMYGWLSKEDNIINAKFSGNVTPYHMFSYSAEHPDFDIDNEIVDKMLKWVTE